MASRRPPAAPVKTRAVASARAKPAVPSVDQLADDLTSLDVSAPAPRTRRTVAAKTQDVAATKRPTAKLAPLGRSTAQNRVPSTSRDEGTGSTKPRSGLPRTMTRNEEEERGETAASSTERAKEAMKVVNAALATLSGLNKAGFRAKSSSGPPTAASSGATPTASATRPGSATSLRATSSTSSLRTTAARSATLTKATQAVRDCSRALKELRTLAVDGVLGKKKVDVERAAGSIVANLVEMEMVRRYRVIAAFLRSFPCSQYRPAVVELAAMRASLLSWWTSSSSRTTPSPSASLASFADTLLFPLPSDAFFAPTSLEETLNRSSARPSFADLAPLVLASQQYLLACLFRSDEEDAGSPQDKLAKLAEVLQKGTSGPMDWRRAVDRWVEDEQEKGLLVKRLDAMMTSMFGTITKGCTGLDVSAGQSSLPLLLRRTIRSADPSCIRSSRRPTYRPHPRTYVLLVHFRPLFLQSRQAIRLLRPSPQDRPSLRSRRRAGRLYRGADRRRRREGVREHPWRAGTARLVGGWEGRRGEVAGAV